MKRVSLFRSNKPQQPHNYGYVQSVKGGIPLFVTCKQILRKYSLLSREPYTIYRIAGSFHWCKISWKCVRSLQPWARNCLVEQKDSALLISTLTTLNVSYSFIGILYGSRLILLYSNHLECKTDSVENYLVHTGTSSYRRMQ